MNERITKEITPINPNDKRIRAKIGLAFNSVKNLPIIPPKTPSNIERIKIPPIKIEIPEIAKILIIFLSAFIFVNIKFIL